jgi:hypothetical protein
LALEALPGDIRRSRYSESEALLSRRLRRPAAGGHFRRLLQLEARELPQTTPKVEAELFDARQNLWRWAGQLGWLKRWPTEVPDRRAAGGTATVPAEPVRVEAWVTWEDGVEELVRGHAVAWTPGAVKVRWGVPPHQHETWVWAGAVARSLAARGRFSGSEFSSTSTRSSPAFVFADLAYRCELRFGPNARAVERPNSCSGRDSIKACYVVVRAA